ncbi:GTPase of the mitochondrial inner membrane that associates with the large ribosomal subunit [Coniosporium tulheliwenetii]|uniref:GTPase of the mitochondrial inner membrane that associates with the large ribosomal subunit n=1 Tax=Coniosporium tulheliwenetii TaxID=3383036 RepID=A0ACC2Z111_9PEZI|nr:GTPase of the mitochondrial inner membrane that associates with the large ribosomal subunit [Cladosporium sp. JES 115]
MPSIRSSGCLINGILAPFLYPFVDKQFLRSLRHAARHRLPACQRRLDSTVASQTNNQDILPPSRPTQDLERLDPSPDSYALTPFTDRCTITFHAGSGGHGCISFLREKYIAAGPPNGGDGGTGGNIYIQAVRGETSLHKLARRGILKAGAGKNGAGKNRGGERGGDVLVTVPVGTVLREVWRRDPVAEEEARAYSERRKAKRAEEDGAVKGQYRRDQWMLYPGSQPSEFRNMEFPKHPGPRRSNLALTQPKAPVQLDLDKPMEQPMLLAAGALGGLGNTHFVSTDMPRPKIATKGEPGMSLHVQLELKLLADVGLVGLPNAGKSTLLRALTNSRARVGDWAFTTLQPNIGTVVLDSHKGRPMITAGRKGDPRTNFTIADIPGVIEDAHLDKGLGLSFLRHIERAAVLAFVVDLSAGDSVAALRALWREVGEYETFRNEEINAETQKRLVDWKPLVNRATSEFESDAFGDPEVFEADASEMPLPPLTLPPITSKPWFVVATKADLPETQDNFASLQSYLAAVRDGTVAHPSGKKNAWKDRPSAVPVSAIKAEGVERIPAVVVDLLNG